MTSRRSHFSAGADGPWAIDRLTVLRGDPWPAPHGPAPRLAITEAPLPRAAWCLQGTTSHDRYVTRAEKVQLVARQEGLGRAAATCAALIPLRKTAAWWALTQDERRDLLESRSRHIAIGLRYLPAIARRLYHCRDLGEAEPFDFLTWFEFAPADTAAFDDLLAALRDTPEWTYVDREVDIRLSR